MKKIKIFIPLIMVFMTSCLIKHPAMSDDADKILSSELRYINDSSGNVIIMRVCNPEECEINFNRLVDAYKESADEVYISEVDGLKACKIIWQRHEDKYFVKWVFECSDGKKRNILFDCGGEEIIEMSDSIMETYHLYKYDPVKDGKFVAGGSDYGYIELSGDWRKAELS